MDIKANDWLFGMDYFEVLCCNNLVIKCDNCISGIKDKEGKYVIPIPRWSKMVYAAGTKVHYYHQKEIDINKVFIPGPTTEKLTIVVSDVFRYYSYVTVQEWKVGCYQNAYEKFTKQLKTQYNTTLLLQ